MFIKYLRNTIFFDVCLVREQETNTEAGLDRFCCLSLCGQRLKKSRENLAHVRLKQLYTKSQDPQAHELRAQPNK